MKKFAIILLMVILCFAGPDKVFKKSSISHRINQEKTNQSKTERIFKSNQPLEFERNSNVSIPQIRRKANNSSVGSRQQIILGPESFEGSFPPSGWSQFSWSSSPNHWFRGNSSGHQGSYVAWVNYDASNTQDEMLQTYSLDLSSFVACTLSFYFWQSQWYEDYLYIGISTDGGGSSGSWNWLGYLYQTGCNWDEVVLDLSDYCGYSDITIGFNYYTLVPDQESEGVDYVTVTGYEGQPQPKPWTVIVFMNGDNNLEEDAIDDINEMERAIDTSLYYVVVEIDRIPGYDASNGNWTSTRDYRILYDSNTDRTIRSQLLYDLGELNMGDPNTLIDLVNYYAIYYPANYYCVILWDHGSGWYVEGNNASPLFKGISHDVTNNDIIGVANHEYYNALDSISSFLGYEIDILAHDACLMAMEEVGYEAKDFVDILIFSEHTEPGGGYPYTEILNWLTSNPNASPQQFATAIVNLYVQSYMPGGSQYPAGSVTQSSITTDLSFEYLTQAIDEFAAELINAGGLYQSDIASARSYSQEYSLPVHIDLYDFAERIGNTGSLPAILRACADSVMVDINDILVAEGHYTYPGNFNVDNSHGLAIYYPSDTIDLDTTYSNLYFATDFPSWWNFLQGVTGINDQLDTEIPSSVQFSIFPNPSHHQSVIKYTVTAASDISIEIYDAAGRAIKTLVDTRQKPGSYVVYWDGITEKGLKVPAGVYFCQIESDNHSTTAKLALIR